MFRRIGTLLLTVSLGGGASAQAPTSASAGGRTDGLTLREAVDAALAGNPALQVFAFDLRAQDEVARQAALRPPPVLSFEAENVLGTGETDGFDAAELTLSLSQVVELGGKRDARVNAARAALSAVEVDRQAAQLDVLSEVTRRFIVVAARQEQVALAHRAVELAERTVKGSETRVNAARSPHAELDRARIGLDRARLDERRSIVQLDTARKLLGAMWGETEPRIGASPIGEVQADLYTMPTLGDFPQLVQQLDANPDFLRFASEARLREAELRLVTTLRKPDLAIGGGVRRLEGIDDTAFVASVSVPLYSGRRAQSYVDEAQARRERVDADQRAARVSAEAALYELHRELGAAVLEVQTLRSEVMPRATEALEETESAFARGRFSYLELVDAQREYLALQATLIESAASAHTLRAEIERLINAPLTVSTP